MRILSVTPYYAPAWAYGGPPRVMSDFARGLTRRGHEVVVLTSDVLDEHARAAPSTEVIDGVTVHRFRNLSNDLAWRHKKYLPLGLVPAALRRASSFDVVHVTDARTLPTAAAFLASRLSGTPLCLSAHGSLPGSPGVRGAVKNVYDRVLVRPMLGRAALLLAQTEHEAALYASAGGRPEAIRMLPLPLPPIAPPSEEERDAFRRRVGVPEGGRLVLFLGRLNHLKGVDLLIEALAPVLDGRTVLALVGRDDGLLPVLERAYASHFGAGRIHFAGPLYGAERFAAYAAADVFCLTPIHWEETSVASLEAAACGTPVVVTQQADLPGLVAAGGGLVVPATPAAVREAVQQVLDAPEMGERARRHVLAQHDTEQVVDRLEQLLLEVVGR